MAFVISTIACAPFAIGDDVGDSITNLGGNQFLVNAGDAIRVTCRGLNSLGTGRSPDQTILFGACGDMVNEAFFLDPANTGGQDRYALGSEGTAEYFALLRQFSGEETSSQGRYSTEGVTGQLNGIGSRLAAIRQGFRTSGLALNLQGVELLALASSGAGGPTTPMVGGAAGSGDADSGFAWFGNLDYGFGDRDDTDFENGFDSSSYGITLGLDYAFDNGVVLGAALGFHEHEIDFDRISSGELSSVSGGEIENDQTNVSAYINYAAPRFYLSGIVTAGEGDYDLERSLIVPASTTLPAFSTEVESDTESDLIAAQAQVGYMFGEGAVTFDIYGGFDYLEVDIDKFRETGSPLALEYGDQEIESEQLFLGGTIRRAVNTGAGVIVPYATVEWRHELDNDARIVNARYALGVPGFTNANGETDNFETPTDDPDENFFEITLGLTGQLGNNVAMYLQYTTVAGLDDTSANLITLGIRGTF